MASIKKKSKGRRKNSLRRIEVVYDILIMLTGIQYQFECRRCGACCASCHPIDVDEQKLPVMADALGLDVQEFINRYLEPTEKIAAGNEVIDEFSRKLGAYPYRIKEDRPCPFFDFNGNLCNIYQVRPAVCRFYPFVFLEMATPEWKSKTITFKSTGICPGTGINLRAFESWLVLEKRECADEIISLTPEIAQVDRNAGIRYYQALKLGLENDIKDDNGLAPKHGALARAYQAYLRLLSGGWQFKFDHREGDRRRVLDEISYKFGLELVPLRGIPGGFALKRPDVETKAVAHAVKTIRSGF